MSCKINSKENVIDLDNLPRHKDVIYKGWIDWKRSVGYKVNGIYKGEKFEVEIVGYGINRKEYLTIKYENKEFEIRNSDLSRCRLGRVLGKITSEFKIEIGQTFKDENRDLIIIDRKVIFDKNNKAWKSYKYHCNKCGFDGNTRHWNVIEKEYKNELWTRENGLLNGKGCSCCCPTPRSIVYGINSIYDTAPWMVKYFKNPEEAKKYTDGSGGKVVCACVDCGKEKEININSLHQHGLSCYCGDGKSYGEKFTMELLVQLGVKFQAEYTPKWIGIGKRRYDFSFVLDNGKYIIEVHGRQHYEKSRRKGTKARTLDEEQENDEYKKQLASDNDIEEENYIVIDCRKSELEWIRDNENGILNSRLSELFDLSKIDWLKCGEFACKNLVKTVCEIKKDYPNLIPKEIGKIFGISKGTTTTYLKLGTKIWDWINYDPKEEIRKSNWRNAKNRRKPIKIFKNNVELGEYAGIVELVDKSERDFGVKFNDGCISNVCKGKRKQHKGFTFEYVENQLPK